MLKIAKIIKKDLKLLVRSKTSSLIVIFGPLLVMLLVGTAFDNSNQYSINVGVYSESYSETANSFIDKLVEQRYSVKKSESNESCIENVKQGTTHVCVIFPPDLKVEDNIKNEIVFHADYSKVNLVWMIVESLSTGLSEKSKEISVDLTNSLLDKLQLTKDEIAADINTLNELKNQNTNLDSKNKEIIGGLVELKGKITNIESNLDSVKAGNDGIKSEALSFKTDTITRIGEIKHELELVRDSILTGANASIDNLTDDSKKYIVRKVITSIGNAENIGYRLELTVNKTDASWTSANEEITKLKQNLVEAKSKIDSVDSESKAIQETLAASITKLNSLETSFNNIHSKIGGIQVTNAENIVNPITTRIQPLVTEKTHLNYIFSGLLTLVMMFIALLLSTTLVMMEKTSPSYFRNFITPTRDIVFVISTFFTTLIIVLIQMLVIVGVAAYFFHSVPLTNLLNIYLVVVLIISVFTCLGMFIGYTFNSQETATLASISIGSLSLLLSNMILPLESMPEYIRSIARFNPFVVSETILKKTVMFNSNLAALTDDIVLLLVYATVLFSIIMFSRKMVRKHFLHRAIYGSKFRLPTPTSVEVLIAKSDKALKEGRHEEAFKYYTDAHDVYEVLRKKKHPNADKLYGLLKNLHEKF